MNFQNHQSEKLLIQLAQAARKREAIASKDGSLLRRISGRLLNLLYAGLFCIYLNTVQTYLWNEVVYGVLVMIAAYLLNISFELTAHRIGFYTTLVNLPGLTPENRTAPF
ncbi:hypothetical protein ACFSSA_05975 [Luteolibacter algae]|uniref:Uncharacterized protein n=1 Tax=Luteolibacter algae TaxID=454151 RepID=A0ABW5D5S8_9BACT